PRCPHSYTLSLHAALPISDRFRVPDAAELEMVTSLDNGVTLVTLAPEQVPVESIRAMVARGAIVCAGHSAASYEQARAGLEAGRSEERRVGKDERNQGEQR